MRTHIRIYNVFKNSRLAPQMTVTFSSVLHPRSHAARDTSQDFTHPNFTPQLARLTVKFLRAGYLKIMCTFTDISSHFNHFEPHLGLQPPPLEAQNVFVPPPYLTDIRAILTGGQI